MSFVQSDSEMLEAIRSIEARIRAPGNGLPEELFLFVSRLTPLINVDLLIRDVQGQILLTWRDDAIFGQGWHVPGGCVRLGESFGDRIFAVAESELGAQVAFEPAPLAIYETVDKTRSSRTHHVSLLFDCRLVGKLARQHKYSGDNPKAGSWEWHSHCPDNILQAGYRSWFTGIAG